MTATGAANPPNPVAAGIEDALLAAQRTATPCRRPSAASAAMTESEGYRIQQRVLDLRLADGELLTGFKLGFTSRAKMAQMGVDRVVGGRLTSAMEFADGDILDPASLINPRIEPEVVFRLGRDVQPDESLAGAVSAVDAAAAGIEVVDSRYRGGTFDLADLLADNSSAAGYVVGPWRPMPVDLGNAGVVLEIDGTLADTGSTAAILGDPIRAIVAAVRLTRSLGIPLARGQVILAGAATAAHPLRPGTTVRASISGLGSVTVSLAAGDETDGGS